MLCCFPARRTGGMADPDIGATNGLGTPDDQKTNEQHKDLGAQGAAGVSAQATTGSETLTPLTPVSREAKGAWERPAQSRLGQPEASTSDRQDAGYRLRWAVNIKQWNPWDDEWLFLLDLLPDQDQKEVRHLPTPEVIRVIAQVHLEKVILICLQVDHRCGAIKGYWLCTLQGVGVRRIRPWQRQEHQSCCCGSGGGLQVQGGPEAGAGEQTAAAAVRQRGHGRQLGERADQAHQGQKALCHKQGLGQEPGTQLQLQCLT